MRSTTRHSNVCLHSHRRQYSPVSESMTHYSCTAAIGRLFAGRLCRGGPGRDLQVEVESDLESDKSQHPRSSGTLIHLLDDDSLLIILSFCRPALISADTTVDNVHFLDGGEWKRERWWYGLIQVCRRWRYLVFDSAFHLQVSLVCARGTPVAEMLAHSPPVPLVVDHIDEEYDILTPEDEEGIIFALQHRNRVRRIRIRKSNSILPTLVVALDGEFPILEHLSIDDRPFFRPLLNHITNLKFPETFRAPRLRHLVLDNFATPIEAPVLATMRNLVFLWLTAIPSSGYFHPNVLHQRLSFVPQLETLGIAFNCYNSSRERQLLRIPIITRVTLPNLRWLMFDGTNTYLEALLPWVTIPLLERLSFRFFNRMIYSIPHLRQFMGTTRNVLLKTATVSFNNDCMAVEAYPHEEANLCTLVVASGGKHLDWQVVSAAQIFHQLKTVLSAVEYLNFVDCRSHVSSEWNRQADCTHWRELLGSFDKVKTLRVEYGLVEQVSLALEPGEGESTTELFPELQDLSYPKSDDASASPRAFTLFIDARREAGRPVTVNQF